MAATLIAVGSIKSLAVPLSISDANFLGSITPGNPASEHNEAAYINYLLGMSNSTSEAVDKGSTPVTTTGVGQQVTLNRSANLVPNVQIAGGQWDKQDNNNLLSEDVTGWNYLLAKYGQDSYIWYVGGLTGQLELSNKLIVGYKLNDTGPPAQRGTYLVPIESGGLSHSTRFGEGTSVPDAGGTLLLLGAAVGVLGIARRKLK